jgi:hypothetical protein
MILSKKLLKLLQKGLFVIEAWDWELFDTQK